MDPQSLNRYSYGRNNPVNRVDPTGHVDCSLLGDASDGVGCQNQAPPLVNFTAVRGQSWTGAEKQAIRSGAGHVSRTLANTINGNRRTAAMVAARTGDNYAYEAISPERAFLSTYGGSVTFHKTGQSCQQATGFDCYAQTQSSRLIHVFTDIYNDEGESRIPTANAAHRWAAHELGHAFESRVNGIAKEWGYARSQIPDNALNRNGFAGGFPGWQQSDNNDAGEIFGDMFVGWTYGRWSTDNEFLTDAAAKNHFMTTNMSEFIAIATTGN